MKGTHLINKYFTIADRIEGSLSVTNGDWLRVKVEGRPGEAWMLTKMGGQQLLVADVPAAVAVPAASQADETAAAQAPTPVEALPPAEFKMPLASPVHPPPMQRPFTAPAEQQVFSPIRAPMVTQSGYSSMGVGHVNNPVNMLNMSSTFSAQS